MISPSPFIGGLSQTTLHVTLLPLRLKFVFWQCCDGSPAAGACVQSAFAQNWPVIAGKAYVNAPVQVIEQRFLGNYEDGLGNSWQDPHSMQFCRDGSVNFPYLSDGMWFLTQFRRWGLLTEDPDYAAVAAAVNQTRLFSEAAGALGLALPASPLRSSTLIDGTVWNGSDPAGYARSFAIKA